MANREEIQEAVDACKRIGNDKIVLLKCCSEYPAPWKDMHLGNIPDMEKRFNLPIGLSDHSEGSLGAVVGVSLGAKVIEKHVRLEGVESEDSKFSMDMEDFAQMVKDIRNAELIKQGPDYTLTEGEKSQSHFRRSIFASEDIKRGEPFTKKNTKIIRPGDGLKPKYASKMYGKGATKDIKRGTPIVSDMIEGWTE
jgi:N-acetylneuraminate synthase/pseudaminic acid synthase